ncbi:hypothetical protein GIB67_037489 [Kingdonia uniflora]|uniref:Uncharacterized protein n=1 Tax=Kingdonia uniflora TaxID=39325 RepID=A0A7J7KXE0_9MAGN|nr:hypothetical protein GIB67_037489 [Kingdonia uniflora]
MRKTRIPFIDKPWGLSKISVLMAKVSKPIVPRLVYLKNTRKSTKKLKLLKHYNYYAFVEEYEFSPTRTSLFDRYKKSFKKREICRNVYSMFSFCGCSSGFKVAGGGVEEWGVLDYALEAPLPGAVDDDEKPEMLEWDSEDDSINQRAEIFIRRFYEEMKLQRHQSVLE